MRALTLLMLVGGLGACQKETAPQEPPGTAKQAAKPGLENLDAFQVISGKLAVKARGGEVWAGGARVDPAAWDTAKHDDGLVEVTLKDGAGKVIDRETYGSWEQAGALDRHEAARAEVERIVSKGRAAPLDDDVQRELDRLMTAEAARLGVAMPTLPGL